MSNLSTTYYRNSDNVKNNSRSELRYGEKNMFCFNNATYMGNQDNKISDAHRRALLNFMNSRGLSTYSWARRAKVAPSGFQEYFSGRTNSLTSKTLQKLADSVGVSVQELLGHNELTTPKVPVAGYVGAGEVFFPVDDHSKGEGIEYVDMPITDRNDLDLRDIIAVKVRGDSMRPLIKDGWILYYTKPHDGVPANCLRELCVVKLKNGAMYIKEVRKGSKDGFYTLQSYNKQFDDIENVKLDWAARVISLQPPR